MKKILCIAASFCLVIVSTGQRHNLIFESPFDDLLSINTWYERSLANPWSATICDTLKRAGASGIRFELRKGADTLFGVRAELGMEPQSQVGESWYGFSNYFPEAYAADPSGEIVSQWQALPDFSLGENWRSPPLALEIKNDRFYLAIRWSPNPVNSNATSSIAYLDLGPVEHARWTDWVFYAKWRYDNTGSLKIWKNGNVIIDRPNQPLGYNDANYPYFKIGIYKWDWQGPSVSTTSSRIYYADEVRIGNALATYNDVANLPIACTAPVSAAISGTTTTGQNGSTSSPVLFTGSGGSGNYTFTYKINNGPVQTISSVGGSSSVTVAQPNAVAGTFVYSLLGVANEQGCTGTVTATAMATITVTATTGTPDLAISQLFSTTQIARGGVIDEVVVIRNVGGAPASGPIVFSVTNYAAITGLTVTSTTASSLTIGFTTYPLTNVNWPVTGTTGSLSFTSVPGFVLHPGATAFIGIRISRARGAKGTVTHSALIENGTAGDSTSGNNNISNTIIKE